MSVARTLLISAATSLTRLGLGAVDIMSSSIYETGLVAHTPNGQACLGMLLFSIEFPVLKHLDLRGWVIECDAMLKFLEGMSSSLI